MKNLLESFFNFSISKKTAIEQAFFSDKDLLLKMMILFKKFHPNSSPKDISNIFIKSIEEYVIEPPLVENLINLICYKYTIEYIYDNFEKLQTQYNFSTIRWALENVNVSKLNEIFGQEVNKYRLKILEIISIIDQNLKGRELKILSEPSNQINTNQFHLIIKDF